MRKKYIIAVALTTFAATTTLSAQDKNKMTHEMTEFYSPEPPVVTPGIRKSKVADSQPLPMPLFSLTVKTFPNGKTPRAVLPNGKSRTES